ncbi:Serine/threonine-protein kinase UCN [Abeliophyllum distichum]|uniref:non-specific serine/threonine protein kinase n=1 Tax=Abeliophyllum distichum TaxID=126358 RepID=A0ABD1VU93_9LAMI
MDSSTKPPLALELDNLRAIKLLGKGAMGTVFLVHDNSQNPFALKVVEKSSLHHSLRRARHEISILNRLQNHPFLSSLLGSTENQEIICWAIPFCPGGDLNVLRHRQADHVFSQAVIRFYLAEIICALEHLHRQGIVYRDLKPENILVQQSGHVTLTDFDLSRTLTPRNSSALQFFSDPEEEPHLKKKGFNNNKKRLNKAKSARVSPVSRRNPIEFSSNERSNSFVGTEEYMAPGNYNRSRP